MGTVEKKKFRILASNTIPIPRSSSPYPGRYTDEDIPAYNLVKPYYK